MQHFILAGCDLLLFYCNYLLVARHEADRFVLESVRCCGACKREVVSYVYLSGAVYLRSRSIGDFDVGHLFRYGVPDRESDQSAQDRQNPNDPSGAMPFCIFAFVAGRAGSGRRFCRDLLLRIFDDLLQIAQHFSCIVVALVAVVRAGLQHYALQLVGAAARRRYLAAVHPFDERAFPVVSMH